MNKTLIPTKNSIETIIDTMRENSEWMELNAFKLQVQQGILSRQNKCKTETITFCFYSTKFMILIGQNILRCSWRSGNPWWGNNQTSSRSNTVTGNTWIRVPDTSVHYTTICKQCGKCLEWNLHTTTAVYPTKNLDETLPHPRSSPFRSLQSANQGAVLQIITSEELWKW